MTEFAKNFSRRDVLAGLGAAAYTLSLGELITPGTALAAAPKKGGKLVYGGIPNSKHKTLKKAKHPYFGLEIRPTTSELMKAAGSSNGLRLRAPSRPGPA